MINQVMIEKKIAAGTKSFTHFGIYQNSDKLHIDLPRSLMQLIQKNLYYNQ